MKKILGILITSLFVTLNIINAVQAANIYRVYNKLENKTYYLTLGSVRFISEEYYVFALLKDNNEANTSLLALSIPSISSLGSFSA